MLRIALILCLTIAALATNVQAATDNFNINNGNWSDTTKWSLGAVPGIGDTVNIIGGYTASVNVDTNSLGVLNLGDATGNGTINQSANTLTVNGPMNVGANVGVGTYNLTGGTLVKKATANGQSLEVGNGTVTIDDVVTPVTGSITIGGTGSGAGWLDVQDEEVQIGDAGGVGTLTMSGDAKITLKPGTHWSNFYVGQQGGTGYLDMSGNASIVSTRSAGSLIVIGGGWNWGGGPGTGTLTMSGSSSINTPGELWIGSNTDGGAVRSHGEVTVNAGCSITTGNNIFVGQQYGEGILNVEGGTVTKGGTVGDFKVGSLGGGGTVNLNSGAIYNNSRIYMAQWYTSDHLPCTFNLNGGLVQATQIDGDTGAAPYAIFNFNGGTLQAMANSTNFLSTNVTARVKSLGAKIDTQAYNVTINAPLDEDPESLGGGLTKSGAGTLKLTAINSYTGPTTVNQGSLIVNYWLSTSSTVTVKSGASLGGNAYQIGPVVMEATSHLAPGDNVAGAAGVGAVYPVSLDITNTQLDYQIESAGWDQVIMSVGALTANGMNTFNLSSSSPGSLGAGNYSLITFNTITMGDTFENTFGLSISSLGAFQTSLLKKATSIDLHLAPILIEWKGPNGGVYSNMNNWTTGVVPNGSGAIAKFGTASPTPGTVNLDISPTVGRVIFNSTTPYNISGANALKLDASSDAEIISSQGSHAISAPVTLYDNVVVSTESDIDTLTISGVISENGGARSLTKQGPGILLLSNANAYTGDTIVNNGTLQLDGANTYAGATAVSNAKLIAKVIANYNQNSSIGKPGTVDPAKLVIDNSTFNYIGTTAASTDRGITLANNVTIDTAQNLAFNGATVLTPGIVNLYTPGTGVVTLGGPISTNPEITYFYKTGTGTLRYNAGTSVTSTIASGSGTDLIYVIQEGNVTFDGTSTTQYNIVGGELNIGTSASSGPTSMTINGGTVNAVDSWFSIGQGSYYDTTLTMTGGALNAYWAAFGNAMGAAPGNQFLNLSGNASLATTGAYMMLGYSSGSNTAMNISGNAQVSSIQWMSIGYGGTGSVTINGTGARLSAATDLNVGHGTTAIGGIDLINGAVQTTNLWIARNGNESAVSTGTVNQSGGTVVTSYLIGGGGNAVYNLDGGSLTANIIRKDPASTTGSMTLNLNGGVLVAGASDDPGNITDPTWFLSGLTTVNVKEKGAFIDTNDFNVTINQSLLADEASTGGGLTKQGDGILTITQEATYTGDTNVLAGTLSMLQLVTPDSDVTVAEGGILEVTRLNVDHLNVASGGRVVIRPMAAGPFTLSSTSIKTVPEPSTFVLLALAVLSILTAVGRKKVTNK